MMPSFQISPEIQVQVGENSALIGIIVVPVYATTSPPFEQIADMIILLMD